MNITKKRNAIINALKNGKTLSEIGREIFNSTGTGSVNSFIEKYGIPVAKYSNRYAFTDPEWLKEHLEECGSPSKLAEKYKVSRTSVTRYAIKYGLYSKKFTRDPKNCIDEHYFDEIDNARKAYWLGFIMADGSVYHSKNGSDKIQFEIKIKDTDKEQLINFAQDIGFPTKKISEKSEVRKNTITHSVVLRTYNKAFCNSLLKYGISDLKSGKETFPKKFIPKEFHKDFIRGFWDGDGNIERRRIYIGSLSINIISQLSKYFSSSDIMSYLEFDITKTNHKIMYKLYISAQSWVKFRDLIYYQGCLGLKRKIEIANNIQSIKYDE